MKSSAIIRFITCHKYKQGGSYLAKLLYIMPVDDNCEETKSLEPFAVNLHIMLKGSGLRLAQSVNIEDGAQVVQFVVTSKM